MSILVKPSSEETKKKLFDAGKSLQPQDVYLREDLTKTRDSILYVLQKVKHYAPEILSVCTTIELKHTFHWRHNCKECTHVPLQLEGTTP